MRRLELKNCGYEYQPGTANARIALEGIDLSILSGELIAIVGKGGSGKSTLSLLLSGLYRPTCGQVLLDDAPSAHSSIFPGVSIVFQYPEQQLFASTVFEEIAFGARNFGVAEEKLPSLVHDALEQVGLDADAMWDRSPFTLSGGQKRRVCIASALVTSPDIIIFDEPSAGLDPNGRRWLISLMTKLNNEGCTVIWVSHDMAEVAELAKRVLLLSHGKLIMDASPADLFSADEVLAKAQMEPAPAAALVRKLKAAGANIPGKAVTDEEAYMEIAALLRGDAYV